MVDELTLHELLSVIQEGKQEKIENVSILMKKLEKRLLGLLPKAKGVHYVAVVSPFDPNGTSELKQLCNTGIAESVLYAYSILVGMASFQKSRGGGDTTGVKQMEENGRCLKCVHVEGEDFELEITLDHPFWIFVYDDMKEPKVRRQMEQAKGKLC